MHASRDPQRIAARRRIADRRSYARSTASPRRVRFLKVVIPRRGRSARASSSPSPCQPVRLPGRPPDRARERVRHAHRHMDAPRLSGLHRKNAGPTSGHRDGQASQDVREAPPRRARGPASGQHRRRPRTGDSCASSAATGRFEHAGRDARCIERECAVNLDASATHADLERPRSISPREAVVLRPARSASGHQVRVVRGPRA